MTIVVSKGRQPIDVTDYTGKPADQAVAALTDAGLRVDATKQEISTACPRATSSPRAPPPERSSGATRSRSWCPRARDGRASRTSRASSCAEARTILEDAGFKVRVENFMGGIFGTVRSQSPAAGTMQPKGSTVTLVVV